MAQKQQAHQCSICHQTISPLILMMTSTTIAMAPGEMNTNTSTHSRSHHRPQAQVARPSHDQPMEISSPPPHADAAMLLDEVMSAVTPLTLRQLSSQATRNTCSRCDELIAQISALQVAVAHAQSTTNFYKKQYEDLQVEHRRL